MKALLLFVFFNEILIESALNYIKSSSNLSIRTNTCNN